MSKVNLSNFDANAVELAEFARLLAHPARIIILQYLAQRQEVPCMEIVNILPLAQPACSRHINELRKMGLLVARPQGTNIFYHLNRSMLAEFCHQMGATLHSSSQVNDSTFMTHSHIQSNIP